MFQNPILTTLISGSYMYRYYVFFYLAFNQKVSQGYISILLYFLFNVWLFYILFEILYSFDEQSLIPFEKSLWMLSSSSPIFPLNAQYNIIISYERLSQNMSNPITKGLTKDFISKTSKGQFQVHKIKSPLMEAHFTTYGFLDVLISISYSTSYE